MDKFIGRLRLRKIMFIILTVFLLAQLFRPYKNDAIYIVENDFLEITNPPRDVRNLFKNSCYDCHSNQTNYKWFDQIAPLSWWVDSNIKRAKISLNFSEWKDLDPWRKLSFLSSSVFDIQTDRMPTKKYLQMHPSARLLKEDKDKITSWINSIDRFGPYYEEKEEN